MSDYVHSRVKILSMIIGNNVTKDYSGTPILEQINFKIGNGRKIGVVGKNGCGKTTLFKLVSGEEKPSSGSLHIQQEILGYLPQEFTFPDTTAKSFFESMLDNDWETYKIDILVDQLQFKNYDPEQKINTLSEGQKMKVKMMELLLADPTTILIDEPTNHLDIEGIVWFERYIKNLEQTVVLISHDRQFLNNVVDEIWEIENRNIIRFVGDYDNYKQEKLRLIDKWDNDYKLFLKKKDQLEKLLQNSRRIKDGKRRGRAVGAAKKRIERETQGENKKEQYSTTLMDKVDFETNVTHKKLMVGFENVDKSYRETDIFKDLSFSVLGGEKVWLFGPNGAGKTTILKMIVGEEDPDNGQIVIGENIRIGYFAQKQSHLDNNKVLLDSFIEETACQYGKAFGFLKKFLFDREDLKKNIKQLSPGQRARFAFAIFAYHNYDLLILDEPTNHLDIETKEIIEDSLREYKGAVFLVSHDRFFVERIGIDKMLNLTRGKLMFY